MKANRVVRMFEAAHAGLSEWLRGRGVRRIFLAGIATDYCVRFTALDGIREGFAELGQPTTETER